MNEKSLNILFKRYLAGDLSSEEVEVLLVHFELKGHDSELLALVEQELAHTPSPEWEKHPEVQEVFNRVENNLLGRIRNEEQSVIPLWKRYSQYAGIAAAVLLLVSLTYLFLPNRIPRPQEVASASNDALPGSDRATLTLSTGEIIELSDTLQSSIQDSQGSPIGKIIGSTMIYDGQAKEHENQPIPVHTLSTPKGGQYSVSLPDGSKVWLNASSSLRYPESFSGNVREVVLTGEGYFEVAKIKGMSFVVKTENQRIEVLGTHFNVNAYANETATKTTLLEGSVRVSLPGEDADSKILKPGQQATSNRNISVKAVDTEQAVSWKEGQFNFQDMSLKEVMRQLERWYDVEVDYRGMPDIEFVGSVPRNAKLSSVLKALEITSNVKFKIEERRISMVK